MPICIVGAVLRSAMVDRAPSPCQASPSDPKSPGPAGRAVLGRLHLDGSLLGFLMTPLPAGPGTSCAKLGVEEDGTSRRPRKQQRQTTAPIGLACSTFGE